MAVIAARQHGKRFQHHIDKALRFYANRFGDNLIYEWFQSGWQDSIMKSGVTLYTNVLYWEATRRDDIARMIQRTLWNGSYFSDWMDYRRHDYFDAHANMLAIIFKLANRRQAESILDVAERECWNNFTLETNSPHYPFWRINPLNYLAGMADYQNRGCLWLQPGILYAVALYQSSRKNHAEKVLSAIERKIIEHNGVYELYEKDGNPVRRFLYKAEGPFAWSAGLFLWACRQVGVEL